MCLLVSFRIRETPRRTISFLPSDQPLITKTSLQLLCLLFIYYNSSYFACNSTDKSSNANNNINNNNKICRLAQWKCKKLIIIALRKYYWCACVFVEGKPAYLIIIINIIIGIAGFICAVTSKKISCTGCFVPAQDEYELYDIDTPDDLIRLSRYLR